MCLLCRPLDKVVRTKEDHDLVRVYESAGHEPKLVERNLAKQKDQTTGENKDKNQRSK
jgi:hypothetical protein